VTERVKTITGAGAPDPSQFCVVEMKNDASASCARPLLIAFWIPAEFTPAHMSRVKLAAMRTPIVAMKNLMSTLTDTVPVTAGTSTNTMSAPVGSRLMSFTRFSGLVTSATSTHTGNPEYGLLENSPRGAGTGTRSCRRTVQP